MTILWSYSQFLGEFHHLLVKSTVHQWNLLPTVHFTCSWQTYWHLVTLDNSCIMKVAPCLANLRNLANFARSRWHLITPGNAWKDLIGLSGLVRACQDSPGLARRIKIVTQNKIKVYQLSCTLIRAHQFSPDASYSIRYCQQSIIHIRSSSIFIVFVNKI